MTECVIGVKLNTPDAKLPNKAKHGDAGADVYAIKNPDSVDGFWILPPSKVVAVDLGIQLDIPDGWEVQVRARSGLASKGIIVPNGPGTIDCGYRGPCKALLLNTTTQDFVIKSGDRVAQFVAKRVPIVTYYQTDEVSSTQRGAGGFGSTGV